MSNKSNDQGRAYEYITLITLHEEILKFRPANIEINSSYHTAQNAWETLTEDQKVVYQTSASAAVKKIFELEPRIIEDGGDSLELLIQPDSKGESGDVRDILIIRRNIEWEVGLSLKHNHFAVKHSRLSARLDFGNSWYGIPCSTEYWEDVEPIFSFLNNEKAKGTKFSDLSNKERDVYVPLLTAFINEIERQYRTDSTIPHKLVEYLLGKYDFYKVISVDKARLTRIQGFNLHGDLNKSAKHKKPDISVPLVTLPTRIVRLDFVPESRTTVELYMDGGWQFTFRIHNAATKVEPSLKFDIQIVGMPTAIITINCCWN